MFKICHPNYSLFTRVEKMSRKYTGILKCQELSSAQFEMDSISSKLSLFEGRNPTLIIRCFSITQHCCLLSGRESVVIISKPQDTRTELLAFKIFL